MDHLRLRVRVGEYVADVEDYVLELATKEDHGDDDGNGDKGDDEGVLDEALAIVLTEESEHSVYLLSCVLGTRTGGCHQGKVYGRGTARQSPRSPPPPG